jgi:dihydropteroate synthase
MAGDVLPQVRAFLAQAAQNLQALGVEKSRIMLDPGIGFGKTVAQNFALLARQAELLETGYPVLAGWSRKSSLAGMVPHTAPPGSSLPATERLAPSLATALLAAERGASVLRVHDVKETVQALRVLEAIR